jgi:predicted transcriptional regulator
MDTTLTIRIPQETKESLEQLAQATGCSKSSLALDAIHAYPEREAWQVAQIRETVGEADAGDFATSGEVQRMLRKWRLDAD